MLFYTGLDERLKAAGLTKTALTTTLGISSRTIAKIAKGEKLSKKTLEKIAAHLGCGAEELCRDISDNPILQILRDEKDAGISGSLYHELQVRMAYNSSRIDGSRLTEAQTRMIYETNTIDAEDGVSVDDVLETLHHFRAMDYIIDTAEEPLTEDLVKRLHLILKHDTQDARLNRIAVGDYKKRANSIDGRETTPPEAVPERMRILLEIYNSREKVTLQDVIEWHVIFEHIHPFQGGNGRVGRLIALKECLRHNIVPFIIEDEKKQLYFQGLAEWPAEKERLAEACFDGQDTFAQMLDMLGIEHR